MPAKNSRGSTRCAASCGQAYTQLGSFRCVHKSHEVAFCLITAFCRPACSRIVRHHFKRMQIDISVGAIPRAQPATDAPIFDNHFQRIAPPNRSHRAAHHAQWIRGTAGNLSQQDNDRSAIRWKSDYRRLVHRLRVCARGIAPTEISICIRLK